MPLPLIVGAIALEEIAVAASAALATWLATPRGKEQLSNAISETRTSIANAFPSVPASVKPCPYALSAPAKESTRDDPCGSQRNELNDATRQLEEFSDRWRKLSNSVFNHVKNKLEKETEAARARLAGIKAYSGSGSRAADDTSIKHLEEIIKKLEERSKKVFSETSSKHHPELKKVDEVKERMREERKRLDEKIKNAQSALKLCEKAHKEQGKNQDTFGEEEDIGDRHNPFWDKDRAVKLPGWK